MLSFPLRALATAMLFMPTMATSQSPPSQSSTRLAPGGYRWNETENLSGPIYMIISLKAQMVHVYNGDRLIGEASVSTGKPGKATPTGEFPILQKRQWHRSNLYSNAPMPFMQRLTWDGIALHAGLNPGYPASHGCIRLPRPFAMRLFDLTKIGTLVEVTGDRLSPMLKLDPLAMADAEHRVLTFTPDRPSTAPAATRTREAPYLDIDPDIFAPII